MNGGVFGTVTGSFDAVRDTVTTATENGAELKRGLEITQIFSLPNGRMGFEGVAAKEELREREEASIDDFEISIERRRRTRTRYTRFAGVTGEIVVVDSGDGTFAFDLIAEQTDTDIERSTLDLDGLFSRRDDATPWKAGFYGAGEQALNGVFHGEDLRDNHDLQRLLNESSLNQLGLTYEYNADEVMMMATHSGYVELYRPAAYEVGEYLEYLGDEIVQHVE